MLVLALGVEVVVEMRGVVLFVLLASAVKLNSLKRLGMAFVSCERCCSLVPIRAQPARAGIVASNLFTLN